ncbi:phage tail protein [Dysgonomonas sp. GY617]|uniref:phage tail protein n=1 Tax=Dysgonomonas sp. GY617 TaxID=2780420 RepID=UPI0018840678|nr:phage tail protein [Dysgonomonas sp. GY617]MBF0577744.1 hypothetical protein [Dysgonomonas sp. GY617]
MISIGNDLIIYNALGRAKISLGISENFEHKKELMKDNSISIQFNLNVVCDFVRGDYLMYEGEKYMLRKPHQPDEVSLYEYHYELIFEGVDMLFQDFIMFYTMQGLKESEWTLTSSARDFMTIALENIKRCLNDPSWILGTIEDTEILNISFNGDNVFDALTTISETFDCEWYVSGKTINLVSRHSFGEPVVLESEVSVGDITRSNDNNEDFCTRLFAFGSTRNIPKNYRSTGSGEAVDAIVQQRLRLPATNGDFIDAIPNMVQSEILEKVMIFENVFPRRIGTITEIRNVDRTVEANNPFIVYFFKDSGLEFKKEYILPGETLMIAFESGRLQGRDFEVGYSDSSGEFEIINDTSNPDMTIPNEILKPSLGDQYVLYNFDIALVSNQYIPDAEAELLQESTKYLKSITEDNATYTCPNVPGYCYQNNIDLDIGQKVQMVSPIFMDGSRTSRIFGFTKSLFNKYICTYIVGDVANPSLTRKVDDNMNKTKKLIDVQYRETSKSIQALNYLRTAMENETVIDNGMILTTLLRMGAKAGNNWEEHAGISGIYESDADPAFWAGGTFQDAINSLSNILFRMDGSGQLAKGNILWDTLGNLLTRGRFESNDDDNRIVIDPVTRSLTLFHKELEVFKLNFFVNGFFVGPEMEFNLWDTSTNKKLRQVRITGEAILINRFLENGLPKRFFGADVATSKIWIDADSLPQSHEDSFATEMYMDGESVNINRGE